MGQVPVANILLVGDGRVARHLTHYFGSLGLRFVRWDRRRGSADSMTDMARRADRVLLAIRDDAISGFVERHRGGTRAVWVHFSGSLVVDGAWSAHPLFTFGADLQPVDTYRRISFAIDAEGPSLDELIPGVPNASFRVPRADRALYHALCVAAGNFTTLLWQRFIGEVAARWNVPPAAVLPYLEQTAANLAGPGREAALTGPLARGDTGTIRRNIDALDDAGLRELAAVYRALAGSHLTREGAAA